jgi:amidase/formamidase
MAPYDDAWEITNRAGAYCNNVYVLACNSAGIDECYTYFGYSMALSPDGTIFAQAPKGIPWLLKADVYPGIIDKMKEAAGSNNYVWQYRNRGASCPDMGGKGADLSIYKHMK